MEVEVLLRGRARVEVAAFGLADAEHLVEKELVRLWPAARVRVLDVRRGEAARIVEEFTVSYRLEAVLRVTADRREEAPSTAFRRARRLLAGTRYQRTKWEAVEVRLTPPS